MYDYFSGKKLYGDDFDLAQIQEWFEDEAEGYANLGASKREKYVYSYHELNAKYGFRFLPDKDFLHALGLGSAYGDEFIPIINQIKQITILDPSDAFVVDKICNVPVSFEKPRPDGMLPFSADSFDLEICFSVLHHIPNVSTVIQELFRCLKPNGYLLVREPTISMGDWNKPRRGLTKRERGIPIDILRKIILGAGFRIVHEQRCMFSLTSRLRYILKSPVYNSHIALTIDEILCQLFSWNKKYHPINAFDKLRPTAAFYVLGKD